MVDKEMLEAMRVMMKEELEPIKAEMIDRFDKVDERLDDLDVSLKEAWKDITNLEKQI